MNTTGETLSPSETILVPLRYFVATKIFSGLANSSSGLEEPFSIVISWETNPNIGLICFKETVSNTGLNNYLRYCFFVHFMLIYILTTILFIDVVVLILIFLMERVIYLKYCKF